ncbi:MAG TPA: RNA chaperone Hfq [Clostridia bacterium]|jgi:host factor-I protein|nr:MAG: RNA-binding protein Hfq [Firmicutes bacterium ADurb.Bin248]HOG01886.1 RNA chaperone Hfq [Clostridia bacterium]HOS18560.1 RNA chaperone Hfq [Clostridia bacterium]HPK15010.1 RNA chaperone Hfq [Clostridia bacterium]
MAEKLNLQDNFLNRLRREKTPVTIHVINGYQLNRLVVTGYDNFVVTAKHNEREIMIYKHAISTITPEAAPQAADAKTDV